MSDAVPPNLRALLDERDWVRALARRLVGDAHEAEDLAQETLAVAWERPPRHTENLRGWLAAVLRNLVRQSGRRSQLAEPARDDASAATAPTTDEVVERAEVHHLVVREVLDLDEPYRSTVLLRYFEGLTPTEIATRQRVPVATVTSRLTRAHARLRDRIDRTRHSDRRGMAVLVPLLPPKGGAALASSTALLMGVKLKAAAAAVALAALVTLAVRGFDPATVPQEDVDTIAVDPDADLEVPSTDLATASTETGRSAEPVADADVAAAIEAAPQAMIAGLVVRPDGSPAADVSVVLGGVGALWFIDMGEEVSEDVVLTTTDEGGRFAFTEVPAGPTLVTAGTTDAAPSLTERFDFDGATPRTDLVLELRRGVRIHGEVVRPDGSLAPNRKVRLLQNATSIGRYGDRLMRMVVTDDEGRFDERNLCPGSWGLVTYPDDDELAEIGGEMYEHMIQATIELEDGQEEFVALGAPSAEAVTVRGRITLGGTPTRGGIMQWIAECDDPMGSQKNPQIGSDGTYEVELPQPGAWTLRVMGGSGHGEFFVDVPEVREHEANFELPVGVVRGRVVDAEGEPVEGARVSHVLALGRAHRSPLRVADDRRATKEDGAFEMSGLTPGQYRIGATHKELGCATSVVVQVDEGATVDGIELVLAPGQRITGRVLDENGLPAAHSAIWIHDAAGRLVNPISETATNKDGRFRTFPLPPGEYSLLTRRKRACASAVVVLDEDEEPAPIELALEPGATIVVEPRAGGEPARAQAIVRDRDGRLMSGLRFSMDPWSWNYYPNGSFKRYVGPLPPGTYVVTSNAPGVGSASTEVTVTPGEAREVELSLR